jgi:TonB family protein
MFLSTWAVLLLLSVQEPGPAEPGANPAPSGARSADGASIKEPKRLTHNAPKWPENALRAGLNGAVVLECTIDPEGRVSSVKPMSGYRSLTEAATRAVEKWRYTPTLLDGKAVPVIMTVTVNFKLERPPDRRELPRAVGDPDPEIRWAAVSWLGRYRPVDGAQRKALEAAAQDSDETVRRAAVSALLRIRDEEGARGGAAEQ